MAYDVCVKRERECVCVKERESACVRKSGRVCVCVCVCVYESLCVKESENVCMCGKFMWYMSDRGMKMDHCQCIIIVRK